MRVVDGDPDPLRGSGHRCQQTPDHGPVRHGVRHDRAQEFRIERDAAVDRRREIGQEDDRVAVGVVGRQPGDRSGVFGRPLDEEARLAVTGRRHHRDDRSVPGRPELAQQPRPAQRPDTPARHCEPGLEERIKQAAGVVVSCGASTLDRFDIDGGGGRGHASTGWRHGPATEPVGQGQHLIRRTRRRSDRAASLITGRPARLPAPGKLPSSDAEDAARLFPA